MLPPLKNTYNIMGVIVRVFACHMRWLTRLCFYFLFCTLYTSDNVYRVIRDGK